MGAPPEFFKGLITTDLGATWQLVPAPGPANDFAFGGFASWAGGRVEALFGSAGDRPAGQVEATQDGGTAWQPQTLTCPPAGPCLRWGPSPSSISGMGAPRPQSLLLSASGGQSWSASAITLDLHASVAGEVAGYDGGRAVVLAGQEPFPARWTNDGGTTWTTLTLPPLPGSPDAALAYPGLQIMPDGSLIALADDGGWKTLPPGADAWCSLASDRLPKATVRLALAGDRVWWLDPDTGGPSHAALAAFACPP